MRIGDGVSLGHVQRAPAHEGVDRAVAELLGTADLQAGDRGVQHDEVEGGCLGIRPDRILGQ